MANRCQLKKQSIHGGWQGVWVGGCVCGGAQGNATWPVLGLINAKNNGALVARRAHSTWFWFTASGEEAARFKVIQPNRSSTSFTQLDLPSPLHLHGWYEAESKIYFYVPILRQVEGVFTYSVGKNKLLLCKVQIKSVFQFIRDIHDITY